MDKRWAEYMAQHHTAPNYARCDIVRHGAYDGCEGACIRIGGPENAVEKYRIVAVCRDLEELKSLAAPDPAREFTVVECQRFEFHEVPENKTYNIEVDDRTVSVTTKEVLDFYPAEYGLKEADIEQYAAAYVARIKAYRECDRWLDPALVRRLLDEEHLMKPRESDSFRLRLHFEWFATLRREDERLCAPFKYAVKAYCLDSIQTFERRYSGLEEAPAALPERLQRKRERSRPLQIHRRVPVKTFLTMIKATIILGEQAVGHYNETGDVPNEQWLMGQRRHRR